MTNDEFCERVKHASNLKEFSECVSSSLEEVGFQQHAYVAFVPNAAPVILDDYPVAYRNHFIQNDYVYIDPILMGTKRSLLPFRWSKESPELHERLPLSPTQKRILEEGSEFGINRGIAVPLPFARGAFGVFVANSDLIEPELEQLWHAKRFELQLLALQIHEAYQKIAFPELQTVSFVLSPRERECLQFLAVGKSLWDISDRLSLSLETVRNYLRSARRKLGVTNTMHAVVKAIRHHAIDL